MAGLDEEWGGGGGCGMYVTRAPYPSVTPLARLGLGGRQQVPETLHTCFLPYPAHHTQSVISVTATLSTDLLTSTPTAHKSGSKVILKTCAPLKGGALKHGQHFGFRKEHYSIQECTKVRNYTATWEQKVELLVCRVAYGFVREHAVLYGTVKEPPPAKGI